nr:2,3-bisphosphoglycerate-independent phosphoglycerate mutase [Nitrospirota bacterium]
MVRTLPPLRPLEQLRGLSHHGGVDPLPYHGQGRAGIARREWFAKGSDSVTSSRPKPLVLIILDGWGLSPKREANAIALAHPAFYESLLKNYPHTELEVAGEAVGLPAGQMGNSEVGHLNIGAGRVVYQDFTRINKAVRESAFTRNPELLNLLHLSQSGTLHLMGLLSDGGVHSHISHLFAILELAKARGLRNVAIHVFLDGRDTPPKSGIEYVTRLEEFLERVQLGRIATVTGRYYAMDRDHRWERVQKAYEAIVSGLGARHASATEAVRESYAAGVTDEFMLPAVIVDSHQKPVGNIYDGDAVLFYNFRADRAREITQALTASDFAGFPRKAVPKLSRFVSMTRYDEKNGLPVLFSPTSLDRIFGKIISQQGMRQFRIAETEKYAHVTYFFNGGDEKALPGEDRLLIPSPKDVATYDQKPQMSAPEVTDEVIRRIQSGQYDVIIMNYANPDMIGHTGILPAAVKAVGVIDDCLRRVVKAVQEAGGTVIITADHGNLEQMVDEKGNPHTAHTTNPVPLILVGETKPRLRDHGIHADIAPMMLKLLGLPQPDEMTGESLIKENKGG